MIRGTTPTHYFKNIPVDVSKIKEVKITYSQEGEKILEKKTKDCKLYGKTIEVTLTQDDTFEFDFEKRATAQVRILTKSGVVMASFPKFVPVYNCNDNEVLK